MKKKLTLKNRILIIFFISLIIFIGCSKEKSAKTVTSSAGNSVSITSVTPLMALTTSQVSIYGKNFDTTLADNKVTINGIESTVDSVSANEVVFTIPANATSGAIKLVTGNNTLTYPSNFTVISPNTVSNFATFHLEHIALDALGNAYGDINDTVYKITPSAALSTFAVLEGKPQYPEIWGTTVDAAGNVYEAGSSNYCIYKVTPSGTVSILAGSGPGHVDGQGSSAKFTSPLGLTIDSKGNLYTNDNHYIRKITPEGIVSTIAGTGADGHADGYAFSATFGNTEGIAVDAKGNIYVSDNEYYNIRKISPSGIVSTLAGSGTEGLTDGKGSAAQFYFPQAMAVDAAGNIFVSDNEYAASVIYTVRRITQDGAVTTFLKGESPDGNAVVGSYNVSTVNYPDGIAFDSSGNMYICNTNSYNKGVSTNIISKVVFKKI